MTKQELRKAFRKIRQDIPAARAKDWSREMAEDLAMRLRSIRFDGVLFTYAALPGEPDLLPYLRNASFHIALPRTSDGGVMEFFLWNPVDDLRQGSLGIQEPSAESLKVFPRPGDCAVIPALAVDGAQYRLGLGAGYYDRWLAEFRPVLGFVAAAVFPPCRSGELLPREPHDMPVDFCLKTLQSV